MNRTEAQTRSGFVDRLLAQFGWNVKDPMQVVEAKKTSKDPALGREQAKQYCRNIQKQFGVEIPFCFTGSPCANRRRMP